MILNSDDFRRKWAEILPLITFKHASIQILPLLCLCWTSCSLIRYIYLFSSILNCGFSFGCVAIFVLGFFNRFHWLVFFNFKLLNGRAYLCILSISAQELFSWSLFAILRLYVIFVITIHFGWWNWFFLDWLSNRCCDGHWSCNNEFATIKLRELSIGTLLGESTGVHRSTSNWDHGVLLKHPWIKQVRGELVAVISVSKHIVLTESPGINLVRPSKHCVVVMSCSRDVGAHLAAFFLVISFCELQFPKLVNELWPIEVVNVL